MTIRKIPHQKKYRIYSKAVNPMTGKHKILGTFPTKSAAVKRLHAIEYFKYRNNKR